MSNPIILPGLTTFSGLIHAMMAQNNNKHKEFLMNDFQAISVFGGGEGVNLQYEFIITIWADIMFPKGNKIRKEIFDPFP